MISTKMLRDQVKCGNVESFEIFENLDKTSTIYFTLRNHPFEYCLKREFVSIISASSYLYRLLDKPVMEGLSLQYKAMPLITVRKTQRRKENETSQSEPPKKQENFQERQPSSPQE